MQSVRYRAAIITGASAGIGAEFARQLAAQGVNLILIARRKEKMEALAQELRAKHAISIDIIPADLSKPDELAQVESTLSGLPDIDLLINNAGFGVTNRFYEGDPGPHFDMLQVHVTASVRLTRSILTGMVARQHGWIINVASVAAFLPYGSVLYPSTKAFLVSFSQALAHELSDTGVRVQALCPGFTYTEFHDVVGLNRSMAPKFMWLPAKRVVSTSLNALTHGHVIVVPGWQYRCIVALARFPLVSSMVQLVANTRVFKRRIDHDQHP